MTIYTKTGDKGITRLAKVQHISKSDERIHLLGNIDELTSHIGLVKASETRDDIRVELERVQNNLKTVMAGIADQYNTTYAMKEIEVNHLEEEINRMESSFSMPKEFIIPGENVLSAQFDITRTVARRAERYLSNVEKRYHVDQVMLKYMNRLSDYLFVLARYTDDMFKNGCMKSQKQTQSKEYIPMAEDEIVDLVMKKIGVGNVKMTLSKAKKLIAKVEEYAVQSGLNAVIAVCGPDGNPIAVHVMDGALLASFDIAMKKAYTSVAIKISTKELGELAQPGAPLYGIENTDGGRIIIFGGGVPLKVEDTIIGGLGVSGGSAEVDTMIADYGLIALQEIMG